MNKRIIFILLGIIFLVVSYMFLKLFVVGTNDYSYIEINNVYNNSKNHIVIEGKINNSKMKYKDYSYILVGREMYLTVNSVHTINKRNNTNFQIELDQGIGLVDHIHLTDDETTKIIYTKK